MKRERKIYDSAFKTKAVQLSNERDNISELARELGIKVTLLYKWRKEYEEFVRNGVPKSKSITNLLKVSGRTIGGIGIGFKAIEVYNGDMSWTEFGVDSGMALVGMTGWGAPVALVYFGGKAIWEYSTGKTLFDKLIK